MKTDGARPLMLALGAGLLLVGAILMGGLVWGPLATRDDQPARRANTSESLAAAATEAEPSRLWAVAGGLSLAVGAGLIGIGLNSWRTSPPRAAHPPGR
jgi:hypothetical protein